MAKKKRFPETQLEKDIYKFWSIRGYKYIVGDFDTSNVLFKDIDLKELSYIYLKQFYHFAQRQRDDLWLEVFRQNNMDTKEFERLLDM